MLFFYMPIIFILQVEVKPYVLDDQLCDECQGARCGGKFAPFFCANVTCLQVCICTVYDFYKNIEYFHEKKIKKFVKIQFFLFANFGHFQKG